MSAEMIERNAGDTLVRGPRISTPDSLHPSGHGVDSGSHDWNTSEKQGACDSDGMKCVSSHVGNKEDAVREAGDTVPDASTPEGVVDETRAEPVEKDPTEACGISKGCTFSSNHSGRCSCWKADSESTMEKQGQEDTSVHDDVVTVDSPPHVEGLSTVQKEYELHHDTRESIPDSSSRKESGTHAAVSGGHEPHMVDCAISSSSHMSASDAEGHDVEHIETYSVSEERREKCVDEKERPRHVSVEELRGAMDSHLESFAEQVLRLSMMKFEGDCILQALAFGRSPAILTTARDAAHFVSLL
eukprot:6214770-Pleurochrysis_carterae.AAC.1